MGWFVAVVVIAYLAMAVFWSKRYYLRRHGVVASRGDVGATSAGLIGLLWPITIWFERSATLDPVNTRDIRASVSTPN